MQEATFIKVSLSLGNEIYTNLVQVWGMFPGHKVFEFQSVLMLIPKQSAWFLFGFCMRVMQKLSRTNFVPKDQSR